MVSENATLKTPLRGFGIFEFEGFQTVLRVFLMVFVVTHSVSTYRSSAVTILGFAVAIGALAITLVQAKGRLRISWGALALASIFLTVLLLTDLPWESPLTDLDQALQRIGFVIIAFFFSFFPHWQVLVSYALAGIYVALSAIPLLVYNPQQAIFGDEGLSGWFHDNNQFGQVIGLTFVAALSVLVFFAAKSPKATFLSSVGFLVSGTFLVLANSFTPIGAAVIAITAGLTSVGLQSLPRISAQLAVFLGLATPVALVAAMNVVGVFSYFGRSTSFTGRTEIWTALLPVLPEHVFGARGGFWTSETGLSVSQSIGFFPQSAHNSFLDLYLSKGIVPLALFIAMLIYSAVTVTRKKFALDSPHFGFGIILTYVLVHSFFESSLWSNFLFLAFFVSYFGIANAGVKSDERENNHTPVVPKSKGLAR